MSIPTGRITIGGEGYRSHGILLDLYVEDEAVRQVKSSEERRHEYMVMMIREMEIREEGKTEGEQKLASLMSRLFAAGRIADAERAARDEPYRQKLFEELGIE